MTVCSRNHEEIIYDDWDCPVCKLVEEKEKLEEILENLLPEKENK